MSDKFKSLHNGASMDTIDMPVHSYDNNDQEEVISPMDQLELYKCVATSGEVY